jgi:antitoxin (DNA-binding transcriptional repressor) of toxin-antitoxin stability system
MKFVTVRNLRSSPKRVWMELKKNDEMVLTSNGKPIAILTPVSEETMEPSLRTLRKARASAAVAMMQAESLARGSDRMTLRQINEEIATSRRGRNKC